MQRRRLWNWLGLIALAVFLGVGFFEVLERRFAEGDVYPHYASFRDDPLGTSAFYESLQKLDGLRVRRNITHLNRAEGLGPDSALLLLGFPRDGFRDLRAPENSAVMNAVEEGARLVISTNPGLVPEKYEPVKTEEEEDWFDKRRKLREKHQEEKAKKKKQSNKNKNKNEDSEEEDEKTDEEKEEEFEKRMDEAIGQRLTKKLEFEIESLEEFERPDGGWEITAGEVMAQRVIPLEFPSWYSQFRFSDLGAAWKTVALSDEEPVVIERRYGKGTVVLASDSFFVSNEGLHQEAVPEFLLWLLGGKKDIVFDETIHGTEETGGAMKLIRRYRLHGVFLGLLIFVFLWAWRSASALAPGSEELDRGLVSGTGTVAGEGTGSGLIRLLSRSIPRENLLEKAVEVWRESQVRGIDPKVEKEISQITRRHREDAKNFGLVQAYEEIVRILSRR